MHFGFALDSSDIDLFNTDLLDTDIPSKHFVLETSLRHVFKTSSRHVFKTSSRHVFKTSSRRLQRKNVSSSKTPSRRLRNTSSRRCGRRKIVTLKTCWSRLQGMSWRRLQDVLKTNKCLLGKFIFINITKGIFQILQTFIFAKIHDLKHN